jgi:hypothetical protein
VVSYSVCGVAGWCCAAFGESIFAKMKMLSFIWIG